MVYGDLKKEIFFGHDINLKDNSSMIMTIAKSVKLIYHVGNGDGTGGGMSAGISVVLNTVMGGGDGGSSITAHVFVTQGTGRGDWISDNPISTMTWADTIIANTMPHICKIINKLLRLADI